MKVTVKQIYNYCKAHNTKMLSNYTSTFWNEYKSNSTRYDFLFMRLFKSFEYIETDFETLDDAVEDFISSVYAHLLVNDKKYSELYRINVLDDSTYSMLDNYNLTETMTKQDSNSVTLSVGEQTDSSSQSVGERTDSNSQSVGARTDQLTMVRDTHTDTLTTDLDEVRTKQLNGVSPFDRATPDSGTGGVSVGGMYDATSSDTQTNPRTDVSTQEYGQHTDTDTNVVGAQTVTGSNVVGAQTVTGSVTNGSRTDHTTGSSNESYTLTRVGNIGIQTPTDILDKHRTFWSAFEFYEYIFQQLSYDYLEIGG